MEMNHENIEREQLIEKYLLGSLNEPEELELEKHFLICPGCRHECMKLEKIMEGIHEEVAGSRDIKGKQEKSRSVISFRFYFRAAAVAILLSSVAFFLYYPRARSKSDLYVSDTINKEKESEGLIAGLLNKDSVGPEESMKGTQDQLAEAYIPSPVFEGAVDDEYRSHGLEIISPRSNEEIKFSKPVIFNWKPDGDEPVMIMVRTNKGQIIYNAYVTPPYSYIPGSKGLYYWQILISDEVMYTGKFSVR